MGYRMNLSKIACAWLLVGLLGAGTMACGDDDDDGNEAGAGGGGTGGSAGAKAGTGGSAGAKAGSGGASGAGAGAGGSAGSIAPIQCNGMMCAATMSANGPLMPCCDAANGMACGAIVSDAGDCVAVKQEGDPDPSCPSEQSLLGMAVPGCCKEGNKCGLQSGTLMGCVERTQYPVRFLMTVNGMAPPKLTAASCVGDMDAGAE